MYKGKADTTLLVVTSLVATPPFRMKKSPHHVSGSSQSVYLYASIPTPDYGKSIEGQVELLILLRGKGGIRGRGVIAN